jgi:transcriptional regulator with XRE-family HTH domain
MNIGEKIRQIRNLKGFSQENIAAELNMSPVAFGDIERGKSSPSFERLKNIAKVLGVTLNDLINFEDRGNNFFDNSQNPNVFGTNNYYADEREIRQQLELERKESEKKDLMIENLSYKVETLVTEINYLKGQKHNEN